MQDRSRRCHLATLCLVGASVAICPPAVAQDDRPQCVVESQATLEGRNCAFLRRESRRIEFLPRTGLFSYHLTTHSPGRSTTGTWRFSAAGLEEAARVTGPLFEVLDIDYEGQPIGRLAHQVMHRGTAWRRVYGNRFVPPGAPASSPVFVEWRRERGTWVVSAIGDEAFTDGVPLPEWCC